MYDFFFHKAFVKLNMSKVAQIEIRVRYFAFKKTIKVIITLTDTVDDLKAQLSKYFEYLGENQYTHHMFAQMSCMDLRADKDEDMWKTASYVSWLICDDSDVGFMFRMKIIYYIFVFVSSACA